jgi:hypothetical protein
MPEIKADKEYHFWTAKHPADRPHYWLCECRCGTRREVLDHNLFHGRSRSCGCVGRGKKPAYRHGMHGSREYLAWSAMKRNHRGSICERWLDFPSFYADMGTCPEDYCLHKIGEGLWEKGTVAWVSLEVRQNLLPGMTKKIEHEGVVLSIAQWARRSGISRQALHERLKNGWTVTEALTLGKQPNGWRRRQLLQCNRGFC